MSDGPHLDPCDCDECRRAVGSLPRTDSGTHLPECPKNWSVPGDCACQLLRACEQRVLLSKPNIELSALYGYEAGRVDGINEAREAVAALNWEDVGPLLLEPVLAAIDGLRGESDV